MEKEESGRAAISLMKGMEAKIAEEIEKSKRQPIQRKR